MGARTPSRRGRGAPAACTDLVPGHTARSGLGVSARTGSPAPPGVAGVQCKGGPSKYNELNNSVLNVIFIIV
jgi:hypothetical protein